MTKFADLHCDTAYMLYKKKTPLAHNKHHISLKKARCFDEYVQFFAIWTPDRLNSDKGFDLVKKILDNFHMEIEKNKDTITLCKTKKDYIDAKTPIKAFLSLEGAKPLQNDLKRLEFLADAGVKLINLTWNNSNEFANGCKSKNTAGLTPKGFSLLELMKEKNIIPDVSHINTTGFWDVYNSCDIFVASHSCAYSLCSSPRNLTDQQIKAVINKKGLIGVNLYPAFLADNKKAGIEKIKEHFAHFISLGAKDNIAFGCDFDGVTKLPTGVKDISDILKINLDDNLNFSNADRFIKDNFI